MMCYVSKGNEEGGGEGEGKRLAEKDWVETRKQCVSLKSLFKGATSRYFGLLFGSLKIFVNWRGTFK